MSLAEFTPPAPINEPVRPYAPGDPARDSLQARLAVMQSEEIEIPIRIGGESVKSGELADCRPPHAHARRVGRFHQASADHVGAAIEAAKKAQAGWAALPWEERAAVFLKAADLLAGAHRDTLNAATMIGQSKNCFQAEIDAACELIDFLRFNVQFAQEIYREQPMSGPGCWNRLEYRPLEGFVLAVTPFNFTAIAGNLPASAALMGNTVVWKPASSAVYSAWFTMKIFEEAGLPPGVINMVPGAGRVVGPAAMASPDLAGVHFTGSTGVFQGMWKTVGDNIASYRSYPRIVGETGGKDFIFAHASADPEALAVAMVRGAFEYQGQKCSAASRCYIPRSIWGDVKARVVSMMDELKMGPVDDFDNFVNAVIDQPAYESIRGYIEHARSDATVEIIAGGGCDDSEGWFIEPTLIETTDARSRTMEEEIFGPVLTVFPYDDADFEATLDLCDSTSPYALTGAIFAQDRCLIEKMNRRLVNAAGNFYVNDKPSGAVVGQQPFGGARASGTNDKAGSKLNLLRWTSPRTIKETFEPPTDYRYPFLG